MAISGEDDETVDLERLDAALVELERLDERKVRVVELRYFAGLSIADSATALSAGSSIDWFLWFVVALLGAALSTLLVGALSYLQTGAVLTALRRRVGSRGLSATRIALDAEKRPPKKRPSIRYRA